MYECAYFDGLMQKVHDVALQLLFCTVVSSTRAQLSHSSVRVVSIGNFSYM